MSQEGTTGLQIGDRIEGTLTRLWVAIGTDSGGMRSHISSWHESQDGAVMGAQGISGIGGDGTVESKWVLQLEDGRYFRLHGDELTFVEVQDDAKKQAELRKMALAKLKPAERVALLGENTK